MKQRRLGRDEARRIAIRAQQLDASRPPDLMAVAARLTFLQLDPTAVVSPSADLVTWSRVGNTYDPAQLQQALEDRKLFEHRAQESEFEPVIVMLRPMANLGLYLADMEAWPAPGGRIAAWLDANDGFRRRVLDALKVSGPLPSRDIPDTSEVPWVSTGWTNDRNATQMLEFMASRGEVAVAARRGKQRLWDLAERVYPAGMEVIPTDEARTLRDEKRLRSLGVARKRVVGEAGISAEIEGTEGEWRLDPEATAEKFVGRTALLSPFDRLIHNRPRAIELFDFEYTLEMYKPKDKRRWGYFALPVLHDDQLIGKVDVSADRKSSVLQVHAVHQDVPFNRKMSAAVDAELADLAAWLALDHVHYDD